MEIHNLSKKYTVRILKVEDIDLILHLCKNNKMFYEYHPPYVTRESIMEYIKALPPNKGYEDKYYVGYFLESQLIAVMDLILDYPAEKSALIGFFMVDVKLQSQNIGSHIIEECVSCLSDIGYQKIHLAVDEGNPQSEAFWTKNKFKKTGKRTPNDTSAYLSMERTLDKGNVK